LVGWLVGRGGVSAARGPAGGPEASAPHHTGHVRVYGLGDGKDGTLGSGSKSLGVVCAPRLCRTGTGRGVDAQRRFAADASLSAPSRAGRCRQALGGCVRPGTLLLRVCWDSTRWKVGQRAVAGKQARQGVSRGLTRQVGPPPPPSGVQQRPVASHDPRSGLCLGHLTDLPAALACARSRPPSPLAQPRVRTTSRLLSPVSCISVYHFPHFGINSALRAGPLAHAHAGERHAVQAQAGQHASQVETARLQFPVRRRRPALALNDVRAAGPACHRT
jgi:hypothetical protein